MNPPPPRSERVVRLFFEPGSRLMDPERRATARLFAGALLLLVLLFASYDFYLFLTRLQYSPPWLGYGVMLAAYALIRAGHYMAAVVPTLCMFPAVAFGLVVTGTAPVPATTLTFPVLSILLATLLLGARGTAVIALGSAVLIAATTVVGVSPLPWSIVAGPLLMAVLGGAIGVLSITHRSRLEQERREALEASAERLERLVSERTAELEAFSYSVSHDLRAPLRAIEGFSAMLVEDHGERLGEEVHELVSVIRQSGRRMSELIDGLLGLSRLTRQPLVWRDLDLVAIARDVIALLRVAEPDRSVELVLPDKLVVRGDEALTRSIMQNLIGNAWKFSKHRAPAHIELGSEERDGKHWVVVRDDGPGFDMKHAAQLFRPFERLHADGEFPGTGIGLAIVQRAVAKHGGDVFAEATVGGGATFRFHLGATAQ